MPIEFQVPTLRVQVTERLDELKSEHVRKQQLLLLEESRIQAMSALEQKQRQTKAFVDRHRRQKENQFAIGKLVLVFQTKMGYMPGKLRFRWMGPFWKWYISSRHAAVRRNFTKMGKWFSTQTLSGFDAGKSL